jgi:ssDNA-binding Zn-finger/Zn-ribbon topoisomerase 1
LRRKGENALKQQRREDAKAARKKAIRENKAEVICNKCGKSMRVEDGIKDTDHSWGYYGLVDAEFSGGYMSINRDGIGDGGIYTFSLCESCLAELFKTFKIPVKTGNYIFGP